MLVLSYSLAAVAAVIAAGGVAVAHHDARADRESCRNGRLISEALYAESRKEAANA